MTFPEITISPSPTKIEDSNYWAGGANVSYAVSNSTGTPSYVPEIANEICLPGQKTIASLFYSSSTNPPESPNWAKMSFGESYLNGFAAVMSMSMSNVQRTAGLSFKIFESSSTVPSNPNMEIIKFMLETTSNLYRDSIESCKDILRSMDKNEDESLEIVNNRLQDTLKPFRTVLTAIFRGLIGSHNDDAETISFLLNFVMMTCDFLESDERLAIIRFALDNRKASVRLAAIEALDRLGTSQAKQVMSQIYPSESRLGQELIAASLRAA